MAKLGMSGADLANRAGVSANTVSAWATGRRPPPQLVIAHLEMLDAVRRLGK